MGEEFYCVLKLVSGEEVFSLISIDENDGDPIVILQDPVVMNVIESPVGTFMKIKPWMELCKDNFFMIKLDKIITMTEVTEDENNSLIETYKKYLNNEESEVDITGKVKVSNDMGYLSSVEDARKRLEVLFKGLKDS
jgi:hypothetical protein